MASFNNTLKDIAKNLIITKQEKETIKKRLKNFEEKLYNYFDEEIDNISVFGSFKRGTILPRRFDQNSDVDILIVFNQDKKELTPQTYINQLQKFASKEYPRTLVKKDYPCVILEMDKIKFDLVPCRISTPLINLFGSFKYQIPNRSDNWINTYPDDFHDTLKDANTSYNSIVKPIIRLLKCWNAYNDYPFSSFELEQAIVDMDFSDHNYETGFLHAIDELSYPDAISKQKKVESIQKKADKIRNYLDDGYSDNAIRMLYDILGLK
jgi:predicted nucleotidyltransferase